MSSPGPVPESRFTGKLRFDVYEADPRAGELRKDGLRVPLEERPFRALLLLLESANEVVTRDELQKQLWPSDVFIDFDHGLNTAISKIRRALDDSADKPRFVETVGRRGYRFIGILEKPLLETASSASFNGVATENAQVHASVLPQRHGIRGPWKIAGALLAVFGVLVGSLAMYRLSRQTTVLPFNTQQMRVHQLTEHGKAVYANVSPDGRYIVYIKRGLPPALWTKQIATGSEVEVFAAPRGNFLDTISFSPDGNYVYFAQSSSEHPDVFDLYTVPVLGGPARRVLPDAICAAVSPDGARIAFVRRDSANSRTLLLLSNSNGSEVRELASRGSKEGFMGGMPAWSPGGKFVAAVATHEGNTAMRDIVVVSAAGGGLRH